MTRRLGAGIALVLAGLVMAMATAWGVLALDYQGTESDQRSGAGRGPGAGLLPADLGKTWDHTQFMGSVLILLFMDLNSNTKLITIYK